MDALLELYEKKIFCCKKCEILNPSAINVYSERNPKCDSKANMYEARKMFLIEYLNNKKSANVMIVGQSPGFSGCGFSGIPFTSEHNAINDIKIHNYHETKKDEYQTEQSANNFYSILNEIATIKKSTVSNISSQIMITNTFQCIPSNENCTGLSDDPQIYIWRKNVSLFWQSR